jgi:hypothetical protein
MIDNYQFVQAFNTWVSTTPTLNGFFRYFYLSTDDSKHRKPNHHVGVMSANLDSNIQIYSPRFFLVTTGIGATKDSAGNSNLNIAALQHLGVSVEALARLGGGMNDNANDAQIEISKTHELAMQIAEDADPLLSYYTNGVRRRPVRGGDPFHIDNLIVKWASIGAFGDTERDNHSEVHHRQLLESIHDIHVYDPVLSQVVMNQVVIDAAGDDVIKKLTIKTTRERQQRWLVVNQPFARWLVFNLEMKMQDGTPIMWEWSRRLFELGHKWMRRAAGEVRRMLAKTTRL